MNEHTLDHVGVAVTSIDDSLPIWEEIVGADSTGREVIEDQGVEVVFVGASAGRIELIAPTRADSAIARFLDRSGPGMHHICYRVPDIRAAMRGVAASGYELIDSEPRRGAQGHLVAFLHPRSTGGVLIELLQVATGS